LHEGVAGSSLVTLEGAGHLSNLEKPKEFTAALSKFLSA
jgi:pimeloyl-ACP methyl ester carboxylesterase